MMSRRGWTEMEGTARGHGETSFLQGCRVLVTGAAGTVGRELVRQIACSAASEIRALDSNESELFFLGEAYRDDPRVQAVLGDVRDAERFEQKMRGIDVVFHAAALKHVPLCERSPFDAVQTNILGVQNLIRAAFANDVRRVIFTSTDKAVNPTSVMGTSKLMGERLITAAHADRHDGAGPVFVSTRFGNVAGSRGSVIPVFCSQIAAGGPVTLTDRKMTRFVMTLAEAVRLVLRSAGLARGGEVFVAKMPVVRIEDLARALVELVAPALGRRAEAIEVVEVGTRPGEKLFEELLNEEEVRRTYDLGELLVVLPALQNFYGAIEYTYQGLAARSLAAPYNSAQEPPLTYPEVLEFLRAPGALTDDVAMRLAGG